VRSNVVAYVALFFALSGSAYAAGGLLVYSDNIVDGQVFSADVADNDLTGVDVANGTLSGFDVADGSLSGDDVTNGTLTGFDVADNTLTGTDIAENTLSIGAMGCQSGKVLGFARVKGIALNHDYVTTWTSDPRYIDITNNCAGGEVLVRSYEPGNYLVKFDGNPAALAVATNNDDVSCCDDDNILTVNKQYTDWDGWYFRVGIRDVCGQGNDSWDCRSSGVEPQSGDFTIVLP
jgi:hypothetical protein